jgi:hypothetical protein
VTETPTGMPPALLVLGEPAGEVLGRSFDEVGELPASRWAKLFETEELDGSVTAFPLLAHTDDVVAVVAIFWEETTGGAART